MSKNIKGKKGKQGSGTAHQDKFRFRRQDNIGVADAEEDQVF